MIGGPANGRIVHLLENPETGETAATALDQVDGLAGIGGVPAEEVAAAMPRSVPLEPAEPADAVARLERGAATLSNIRVADPRSFDAVGRYRSFEFISGFSDAGAHVWAFAGMGSAFMAERNWGRIAVESKLTVFGTVEPGAVLRQISWIPDVAPKSMALLHQVDDVRTGKVIARGDVRVMILDFATRRSVPIPDVLQSLPA
ncbi:hypothetical protein DLJ53_30640 [Acuticoccus sediminis]|uniref:Uncharacterized protein n=1 Tax=Acuticoccus sediminis TaxID=2184697 RepID=A0A8B2NN93_9HYPH|nr:hypothetical protein DLJ53_30640 [Acuticoccus sediminis]